MFYQAFNEMWGDANEVREEMLALYDTLDYLPRLLTKAEIVLVRDLIEATAPTQTFAEFCSAVKMTVEEIAEEFELPADVISSWCVNGIPDYAKKMLACSIVSARIEDGRCHTCQGCGEFFFSTDPKEVMCEECKREMATEMLDRYVLLKKYGL